MSMFVAAIALGMSACGGGASSSSSTASSILEVVGEVGSAGVVTTTIGDVDDRPSESIAPTGSDDSASTPESTTAGAQRLELRTETPLAAGAYRSTKLIGPLLTVELDLPIDGLMATDEEGALSINGADDAYSLFTVFHLDNGVVLEATVDPDRLPDREYAEAVMDPSPPDVLEWFAQRPGVVAGPVEEGEFGGVPSRKRTVRLGPFDGGLPCSSTDESICHWLTFAPLTGLALVVNVGDEMTVHELTVAGHRLMILIEESDDPATAESIASSVRFVVTPHPASPPDSTPLPFTGPLRGDTVYTHERSSGGLWFIAGTEGIDAETEFLRDRFVTFSSDGSSCLSITDGSQGRWYGKVIGPDGPFKDGRGLGEDLEALLEKSPDLEVVAGPTEVALGDVTATSFDVRPVGDDDVVIADTSNLARAGEVTRIVAAPRTDSYVADLVVVALGSPCGALVDGLEFVPGAER
jgi:hypothetical protein